jgi:hypothetical protein
VKYVIFNKKISEKCLRKDNMYHRIVAEQPNNASMAGFAWKNMFYSLKDKVKV